MTKGKGFAAKLAMMILTLTAVLMAGSGDAKPLQSGKEIFEPVPLN